ncbi:MAG TPA: hypothetical protein VJK09_02640 [Candidatus Paceibacterota bacterium]
MNIKISKFFALSYILIFAFFSFGFVNATSDTINANVTVNSCNQNNICEAGIGETPVTCPNDCPLGGAGGGGGGGGGGGKTLSITNVLTSVGTSSVIITWDTNLSAISSLYWGQTPDYELGSIVEINPSTTHSMIINGLSPTTSYFFKIEAYEFGKPSNNASSIGNTFTTKEIIVDANPANPSNFIAEYQSSSKMIKLTWNNPKDSDFSLVRILRSTSFFPGAPDEGTLVYEGANENFFDSDIIPGVTYYYTIFSRNIAGNYSSGAVDAETVPKEEIEECKGLGCPEPEIEPEPGPEPNIFDDLPVTKEIPPELMNLNFLITQDGTNRNFKEGSKLTLDASKNIVVSIPYPNLPEVLKTIAVTMRHPKDPNKIFSFLLRVDKDKQHYESTIAPLLDAGEYIVTIYVLDHKHEKLAKIQGTFLFPKVDVTLLSSVSTSIPEQLLPIGGIVGIVSGLVQTVVATANIGSFYDLYLIILRFLGAILGLLGLKRKHKPWGTVYDSVTKRPLDPAYVVVKKNGKDMADAITDLDGRYGFLLPSGKYAITAGKTHYEFPSKNLANKDYDELYANLYHGEELLTAEGEVITRNIPLDPISFDWNEFVKSKQKLFKLYSRREKIKSIIFDFLYLLGFLFTLLSCFISPTFFNFVLLSFYVFLFVVQTYWHSAQKAIMIKDAESGEPYSFAIVRVFLANLNQEVKRLVADEFGRLYLIVSPGRYYITIDAKKIDGSYRRVYRSAELDLSKGILTEDISIGSGLVETKLMHA